MKLALTTQRDFMQSFFIIFWEGRINGEKPEP